MIDNLQGSAEFEARVIDILKVMVPRMIEIKLDVERSKTTTVKLMVYEHDHLFRIDSGGNVVGIHRLNANDYVSREA